MLFGTAKCDGMSLDDVQKTLDAFSYCDPPIVLCNGTFGILGILGIFGILGILGISSTKFRNRMKKIKKNIKIVIDTLNLNEPVLRLCC